MKSIFITGATGFCGKHLCTSLTHKGFQVTGTHYSPSESASVKNVKYVTLDITDKSATEKSLQQARPDVLIHLAAQTIPQKSWEHIDETFRTNIDGAINILEAVKNVAPQCKLLFISTNQVYGRLYSTKSKALEIDCIHPHNPYAVTKAIGEQAVQHYVKREGLFALTARPFNHFGPGQNADFVFSDWCKQIVQIEQGSQEPVIHVGNLKLKRDVLSVHDIVSAYEILAERGQSGEVYNICTEQAIELQSAMDILKSLASKPFEVRVDKSKLRDYDPVEVTGSAEKLKELGWNAGKSLADSLEEVLSDWRERLKS